MNNNKSRHSLQSAFRASLIGFVFLCAGCGSTHQLEANQSTTQALKQPPNVIILFADDLGYGDLGSYGNPNIDTPNLDDLAAQGQRWTDFYVASPVCSPSRGALMTGNYAERSGLYGRTRAVLFPNEQGRIPDSVTTLPEALKSAGYATAIYGKWHLGDQPEGLPTRHGFDQWLGIPYSNDMDWMIGPTSPELFAAGARGERDFVVNAIKNRKQYSLDPKNEYWDIPLIQSAISADGYEDVIVARPPDQSLITRLLTTQSVNYIEQQTNSGKPFFLYLAYSMPHVPIFASPEFDNVSRGGRYGDVVTEIDWSVGQIRAALEAQGIAENTLLIFSSDNGPWLSMDQDSGSAGPLRNGKATTFEGGSRVPAIFWWPGTIKPKVEHGIGTVMDLYATILSLVGIETPAEVVDSIDLSPALFGQASPRDSFAYYRSGELFAFRKGNYKAHFITQGAYGMPPAREIHQTPLLYNLGDDPGEKFDIAERKPEMLEYVLESVRLHQSNMVIAEPIFEIGR